MSKEEDTRVLVTGAYGMLGSALAAELERSNFSVYATGRNRSNGEASNLDVRVWEEVRHVITSYHPNWVLHLAAETDVDLCEQDPDHAFVANAVATENVALVCKEVGATMVYISTANVFDGKKSEPYIEYDNPCPVNVYGRSKLAGERAVQDILDTYFIFRAGWMVGGWEIDKKFVYKIVQLCRTSDGIKAVDDKFGSPTFTRDFACNLIEIMKRGRYGLYHLANRGNGSRYDIACEIVKVLGLEERVEIEPVSSSEFPLPAPRPDSEMMMNYKLDQLGLNEMPQWQKSLGTYLRENEDHWPRRGG